MIQEAASGRAKEWTIVIPALNEEKCIGRCLDAIAKLSTSAQSFEVLLVDNGSVDKTISIAQSYTPRLNLRVLQAPGLGIGALRNLGASQSTGEFLAFVDADCLAPPAWLNSAATLLRNYRDAVIGSQYALPEDAGWPARVWRRRFHDGRSGDVAYVPAGNLLISRELFRSLGGFNAKLKSNEDSEFCSRALASGYRVLAFPELAATHLGAEKNLRHFMRRQMWHGANVCNGAAFTGNVRALSLATYTLACAICLLLAICLPGPVAWYLPVAALLLAPAFLCLGGLRRCGRDLPRLFLLLFTYSVVRACVLPLAALRGVRECVTDRSRQPAEVGNTCRT